MAQRLADVEVPRFWWLFPLVVLAALLVRQRRDVGAIEDLNQTGAELGQFYGERYADQDKREAEMLDLNRKVATLTVTVTRLTWLMAILTIAAVGLSAWALILQLT